MPDRPGASARLAAPAACRRPYPSRLRNVPVVHDGLSFLVGPSKKCKTCGGGGRITKRSRAGEPCVCTRPCSVCGAEDRTEHGKCAACARAYRRKNIEQVRAYDRARYASDPERFAGRRTMQRHKDPENRTKRREAFWKSEYGLTREDVERMRAQQRGTCANAGCTTALSEGPGEHIDHCHVTGKVRGLLCPLCNVALGALRDDEARILGLAEYLRGSREVTNLERDRSQDRLPREA